MNRLILIFTLFLSSLFFQRCSTNDAIDQNTLHFKYLDDKTLVKSIVYDLVLPEINSLVNSTNQFYKACESFIENKNQENLFDLKLKWLKVSELWSRCYAFNVGDLKEKYYNFRVASFPINVEGLESKILNQTDLNYEFVSQMGADTKGLFAIEYLLFNNTPNETLNVFKNSSREKMLLLLVNELLINITSYKNEWELYATTLINKDTYMDGSIDDPLNILFNGIYNILHYTRETVIGKSAGFENNNYPILENVQARFSKKNIYLVKQSISICKKFFFDKNHTNINDKIFYIKGNNDLNTIVLEQFNQVFKSIDALNSTYFDAIQVDNEKVRVVYDELKQLEVLFLVDVRSTLSLIITGTDGDGD